MKRQAGFTLLEMTVAMAVLVVAGAGVVQMLGSMGTAATFQRAKTRTVDRAQALVEALSIDLAQSAAGLDPAEAASPRLSVLDGGRTVQFQRVVGVRTATGGEIQPAWTAPATVSWDPATGVVTRRVGAGAVERLARGISEFEARALPDGLVRIRVVSEAEVRGETVRHTASVHVKTRN